jgi:hypothetical protein
MVSDGVYLSRPANWSGVLPRRAWWCAMGFRSVESEEPHGTIALVLIRNPHFVSGQGAIQLEFAFN